MADDRAPVARSSTRYRLASSVAVVLAQIGACLHYSLRDPVPPQRSNVIAYLETVGPFWPLAFGVGAAAIVVALAVRRALHTAHTVAAGVFAAYAFALFYTAASTGAGWVTACFSVGLAVHATALAASYATEGWAVWTRH